MKIQLNGATLNNVLKKVKPFIDLKNKNLPILQTIKITATDDVYITTTDLENTIIARVPGNIVFKPGEICVDYKGLIQMVKGQTEQIVITKNTIENGMIINYQSMSAEDYPNMQRITADEKHYSTNLSNDFIKGLETCLPHALDDKKSDRVAFKGIWIDNEHYFACDTRTLALYKQNEIQYPKNILIYQSAVKGITGTFKKDNNIQCKINSHLMELSNNEYTVICRIKTDTNMPPYNHIINGLKNEYYITVDTKYFKSIVDKIPKNKQGTLVDLKVKHSIVKMSSDTVKPFEVKCKDEYCDGLEICYNNMYMQRLINSFDLKLNKELTIKFNGRTEPFVIQNDKLIVLAGAVIDKNRAISA